MLYLRLYGTTIVVICQYKDIIHGIISVNIINEGSTSYAILPAYKRFERG